MLIKNLTLKWLSLFLEVFKSFLILLPSSKSLSYFWNFGSFLGIILFLQIFTGILLAIFYSNDSSVSFNSVQFIMYDVMNGWLIRLMHFNGASLFFIFIYLHIFKGLFFLSYRLSMVWFVGLLMYLIFMLEAFLGYVLVWAQMSFWAAVVITSLLSVIPYLGNTLVYWVWGGFLVVNSTLKFFFVLHFLLPFFSFFFLFFHLYFLHMYGSTSYILNCNSSDKISFFPYYWNKDMVSFIFLFFYFLWCMYMPFFLGDSEMYIMSDSLKSPVHIVPEWYYLVFYAILRSFDNKILGIFLLFFSILIFFFFCLFLNYLFIMDIFMKLLVIFFFFVVLMLTWLGQCSVEPPFIFLGMNFSFLYFILVFLMMTNYISMFFLFF